jgi:hypothetical protein
VSRLLKAYRTEGTAGLISKRENFRSKMTRQRIRHGIFRSIAACRHQRLSAEHNTNPKLFPWTKSADAILAKLDRLPVPSV